MEAMSHYKGYDERREDLYEIKGDPMDGPDRGQSRGVSQVNFNRTAKAHPKVRYREFLLTCDLYQEGEELMVHLICPRCKHNLQIKSSNKKIYWDEDRNLLSVEPFKCTWELDDEHLGARRDFGFSLCNWSAAIDNGIAKEV